MVNYIGHSSPVLLSTERSVDRSESRGERIFNTVVTVAMLGIVLGLFLFGVVMCLPGLYAEIVPGITKLFEQR